MPAKKKTEQSETTSNDTTNEQEEIQEVPETPETRESETEAEHTARLLQEAQDKREQSLASANLQHRIEEWQSRTKTLTRFNGKTLR